MIPNAASCWQAAFAKLSPDTQKKLDSLRQEQTSGCPSNDIDSIIALSRAKQVENEGKGWIINIGSRKVNVRHAFSKVIDWLDKFKAVGDTAVNFDPVHAALPWAAFRFILQSFIAEREQMGHIITILEETARLVHHGKVFEKIYLETQAKDSFGQELLDHLRHDIVELYVALLDGLSYCCSQLQRHTIHRVSSALLKPDDAKRVLEQLHDRWGKLKEQAQRCDNCLTVQISEDIQRCFPEVYSILGKIFISMQSYERTNMLEKISTVPFTGHHIEIQDRRTPDTGEWILKSSEFQQWQDPGTSSITLLYGIPGAGKTFLTSRVIDYIEEQLSESEGFAYFYCKRDEKDRSQPASVLSSLIRQLASPSQRTQEIHQEIKDLAARVRERALTLGVKMCQEILSRLISSYSNTTIILDALDECDSDERSHFMECLSHLMSQQPNLRIFISSRKEADIIRHFKSNTVIEIQGTDNQNDIECFLKEELARDCRWSSLEADLQYKVTSTLFRMSQGMFQWAALQVQQLRRLKSWNRSFIEDRLGKLPRTLADAYEEIWQMILCQDGMESQLAKRAICWVLCAPRPLFTEELSTAIKINTDDGNELFDFADTLTETDIHNLCHNFLRLETGVWRFCHLSAIEYVETALVDQLQPYQKAAFACIKYVRAKCDSSIPWNDSFNYFAADSWPDLAKQLCERAPEQAANCQPLLQFLGSAHRSSEAYQKWASNWNWRSRNNNADFDFNPFQPSSCALYAVCFFGLTQVLREWCEAGTELDLNACNRHNVSPLGLAAGEGHADVCRLLLDKGANLNGGTPNPLMQACYFSSVSTIPVLIEAGANIHMAYEFPCDYDVRCTLCSQTPIRIADKELRRDPIVTRLLLEYLVDVNWKDSHGCTALDHALMEGHLDKASALEQHGARFGNPNQAIRSAVGGTEAEWIKKCIEAGADVNICDERESALMQAARYSSLAAVDMLIEMGADINQVVEARPGFDLGFGPTALAAVCASGYVDIGVEPAQRLLDKGADPNIHDGKMTPLIQAAWGNDNSIFLEMLLDAGADVNFLVCDGVLSTALVAAVIHGSADKVQVLLTAGADANLGNKTICPLSAAISDSYKKDPNHHGFPDDVPTPDEKFDILILLLEAGADPSFNNGFSNCLCTTARNRHQYMDDLMAGGLAEEHWQLLIDIGADPTLTFNEGPGSALACAAFHGNARFCHFLLDPELGVDPNAQLHGWFGNALLAAVRGADIKRNENVFGTSDGEFDKDKAFLEMLDERYHRHSLFSYGWSNGMLGKKKNQTDDVVRYYLDVVQILLQSGAEVPMPMYRALGPLAFSLQLRENSRCVNGTLGFHVCGRTLTHLFIPEIWVCIIWNVASRAPSRTLFDRKLRCYGLQRSLPPSACIYIKLFSSPRLPGFNYVAIHISPKRCVPLTYNKNSKEFKLFQRFNLPETVSMKDVIGIDRRAFGLRGWIVSLDSKSYLYMIIVGVTVALWLCVISLKLT
ncbi:unnamed protein product [Clonostachys rosea]|uniref:NACHT domain-containing protein n=1 Tax=Bionectria ochroleuca TaxID=29856 RepID=A0ABY6UIN9_BIOOC|nr:unnamed protein product [Clonostachys rosea]